MTTNSSDHILYLNRNNIERICNEIDSVAIIREAFQVHASGQTVLPDEAYLGWINSRGENVRSLNMPGYLGGSFGVAGTKIINSNIANSTRRLPRAGGLTLIYDDNSVRVVCILESAYISSLRTASVTALAVDLLAGPDLHTVAVIGAGALARAHIELLVKRFPQLRCIQLFDVDPQRATALQLDLSPLLYAHDITLRIAASAKAAIRPAQLIVPATTVTSGYILFEWLQPGSLLVNVSLDDPLPEVVLKADLVIVDDWNLVRTDHRRLIGRMYREGLVIGPEESFNHHTNKPQPRRIDAQLGDLVTGTKAGRRSLDDIILVNPFGLSIEDISLAARVYEKALIDEIGNWLER